MVHVSYEWHAVLRESMKVLLNFLFKGFQIDASSPLGICFGRRNGGFVVCLSTKIMPATAALECGQENPGPSFLLSDKAPQHLVLGALSYLSPHAWLCPFTMLQVPTRTGSP